MPVLPARIACKREMHVVVVPDQAQVGGLSPISRDSRRGHKRYGVILGDEVHHVAGEAGGDPVLRGVTIAVLKWKHDDR